MLMSSRIRSGGSRCAASSASLPPGTGRTLYPRSLSMPDSTWRLAGVSSTTRMLAGCRAALLGLGGSNGCSCAEYVEQFLVLKRFGQSAQPARGLRVAAFRLLDPCQQQVQVRRDHGLSQGVDQFLCARHERVSRQFDDVLLRRGRGVLGVDVFDADLGVNLLQQ